MCIEILAIDTNTIPGSQEKIVIYTADTLGMAVATSVLATLVVGFVAGYLFSRHFRHDPNYSNMPLHSNHQLNRYVILECSFIAIYRMDKFSEILAVLKIKHFDNCEYILVDTVDIGKVIQSQII